MVKRKKTESKRVHEIVDLLETMPNDSVKRVPVDYDYNCLNPTFIKGLGRIGAYAAAKYGSWAQYLNAELTGEKSPINHALEHIFAFQRGEKHDHFGTLEMQLVAAAYNLMMQVGYLQKFGFHPHPLAAPEDPFVRTKSGQIVRRKAKR